MNEADEHYVAFPEAEDTPETVQPRKQALNFVAALVRRFASTGRCGRGPRETACWMAFRWRS
jgi:hypothetical protein